MQRYLMFISIFLLIFITCIGCNNNEQKVDLEFKANFQNCLQIISMRQIGKGYVVDIENTEKAFVCLEVITGIKSQVLQLSDTPYFYPDSEEKMYEEVFFEDYQKWSNWFEANKYTYTNKDAKMAFAKYSEGMEGDLEWPESSMALFSTERYLF